MPPRARLSSLKELIDHSLKSLLAQDDPFSDRLAHAARYAVLGGGKRLRALITLVIAEQLGADLTTALQPACAVELLHAYSLVHDDLPCMDNDDERRGAPSLHKQYDETTALLCGDDLQVRAFRALSEAPFLAPQQQIALIRSLAHAAGNFGMIGGQLLDLGKAGSFPLTEEILIETARRKTGALFKAAALFGGIVGSASHEEQERLGEFGLAFGIAFQIRDDLNDCLSPSDQTKNSPTFPQLCGPKRAEQLAQFFSNQANALLRTCSFDTTLLEHIVEQMYSHALETIP